MGVLAYRDKRARAAARKHIIHAARAQAWRSASRAARIVYAPRAA